MNIQMMEECLMVYKTYHINPKNYLVFITNVLREILNL